MVSQAEKWEARRKKTEELKKQNKNFGGGKKPAVVNEWDEKLKASDEYKKALLLGVNMDGFSADSQEKFDEQIELLKKKIEEIEQSSEQQEEKSEQEKPQEEQKKETLEVESVEKEPTNDDLSWINDKRAFYKEFANQQGVIFKNDEQKDLSERSFTFSLEKNGKSLGEVKYTSPNAVKISNDSDLIMYQGLVKDALNSNLKLSFGKSLNDTQKAMLMAAVLLNEQKTYADGSGIVLENVPAIDTKAEYFKKLPQKAQTVLTAYAQKQAQKDNKKEDKEKFNNKIKELRTKIRTKAAAEGKNTTELSKEEYRAAMLEGMTAEDKKARQDKLDEREKTLAARLGIIKHSIIDKSGNKIEIQESKDTKDLINKQNPELIKILTDKYGKGR